MSEQVGSSAPPPASAASDEAGGSPGSAVADPARPGDQADRDLAEVAAAMAAVRTGVPTPAAAPTVPSEDEVAGLEQAHESLRSTLDRVDRGG